MTDVRLERAGADRLPTLANMFQLYTHDFSEHWAGTEQGELGEDGRFEPYAYLESYWSDPDRVPLLLRAAGRLAGFCLINRHHHGARPVDWSVAEFFVVRKHRRAGVGAAAARQVFQQNPGVWEVAVARRNTGALVFWRGVIEAQPRLSGLEELADASSWDGTVFRFRIG